METIISVKNLMYKYEDMSEPIIKDLTFKIQAGEKLAIVGSNGSGKSTLIRLLNGLLKKTAGEIEVTGIKLSEKTLAKIRANIGMVFQNPDNQFVGATVENDIAFGLENKGMPYEKMHQKVAEMLVKVQMEDFKTKEPAQLSGGQKQRVAIASVMATDPKILILDEATSMLDPEGRQEILDLIFKMQQTEKMTLISVTHDLAEIMQMDRVIVLDEGQIKMDCTPRELFNSSNLEAYGLIKPFTEQVKALLADYNIKVVNHYQTEEEFCKWLQSLNLTM